MTNIIVRGGVEFYIRDNYLPQDTYEMLYGKYMRTQLKDNEVHREFFDYDPTPEIANYINFFNKKRGYKKLAKWIHTAATPSNFQHKVHCDADFKIMSAIVYIAPEESYGTSFYLKEQFDIEWKPNRLVVFCGEDDVTWHDYKSSDGMRFTYNYFLVDPTKIQRPDWKNRWIK